MKEMDSTEETTWLFEDALYSIDTAGKMGIKTVGIYDFSSASQQDEIRKKADIYIKDWSEYKSVIEKMF